MSYTTIRTHTHTHTERKKERKKIKKEGSNREMASGRRKRRDERSELRRQ